MKICIAQTTSLKGSIPENIENHLEMIRHAIIEKADLIIFPELSITNYEPELAKDLAINPNDAVLNPFEELSNQHRITIGIGMPTLSNEEINISMIIFQSGQKRQTYSKQILHSDEVPYFACGEQDLILKIKQKKVAFGICYESLQRKHFIKAYESGADIYIASVAKSQEGLNTASNYFPTLAHEFKTPILMSNSVGPCDNFVSVGQSSVWDDTGKLLAQLGTKNQGFIIYDSRAGSVAVKNLSPKE